MTDFSELERTLALKVIALPGETRLSLFMFQVGVSPMYLSREQVVALTRHLQSYLNDHLKCVDVVQYETMTIKEIESDALTRWNDHRKRFK